MISVNVDVELDDIIDQIPDAVILDLARGLGDEDGPRAAAISAINHMRAGRLADAATVLERQFLPKWKDKAACEDAYRLAMGRAP